MGGLGIGSRSPHARFPRLSLHVGGGAKDSGRVLYVGYNEHVRRWHVRRSDRIHPLKGLIMKKVYACAAGIIAALLLMVVFVSPYLQKPCEFGPCQIQAK